MLNKISTHLLVKIAVVLTIFIICLSIIFCNFNFTSMPTIKETNFEYFQTKNTKYDTNLNSFPSYQSGKIILVSNYKEYQTIINEYKIIRTNELTAEDFEENNYVYVIIAETACQDDFQYNNFSKVEDQVTFNFTTNNCLCYVSSLRNRAYEILVPKDITSKTKFNINYTQINENIENCPIE